MNLYEAWNTTGLTENGCKTNLSSLDANLDLFFAIGSSRKKDITPLFVKALVEDKNLAIRNLLHARDIRNGLGERQTFKDLLITALDYLSSEESEKVISMIPELGRYDDLQTLFGTKYEHLAVSVWLEGIKSGNMLAAKWCPVKDKKGAKPLRKALNLKEVEWRKMIVPLRDTVEQKMCAKEFGLIDYSKLPSVASARYMSAFHKNDTARYQEYKDSLVKGEAKVNAGAVYPYDITKALKHSRHNSDVANAQWKALPNYLEGNDERILPIVDVSGSMTSPVAGNSNVSCMDVAVSLGLYISERTEGLFKDVFMTFSERPTLVKVEGTLEQKVRQMESSSWGMSTDIQAVFTTLLGVAKKHSLPEEHMPTKLLIVSDMQFNSCIRNGESLTAYDMCKAEYEDAGYKLPQLVFWQVNAKSGNIPVTKTTTGTALVSGFSPTILTSLLGGNLNPISVMKNALLVDIYNWQE